MKVKNKSPWLIKNSLEEHDDEKNLFRVSLNSIKVKEDPQNPNVLMFSRPMVITDDKPQYNGTRYDIASMNIDGYRGLITIDHSESVRDIVGKVVNLQKKSNKVTIDGIEFATKENPVAQLTRDMMLGGFATDVSIETIGKWPDDEGVYRDSSLVGLSIVIVGNNQRATLNSPEVQQLILNSIEEGKKNKLDVSVLEKLVKIPLDKQNKLGDNELDMLIRVTNSRNFAVTVSYKDEEGKDATKTLQANEYVDVVKEQADAVTNQIKDAVEPKKEEKVDVAEIVKSAIASATEGLTKQIKDLEQKVFDNGGKEPEFKPAGNGAPAGGDTKKYADMGYKQRHGIQILKAWDLLKNHDSAAGKVLSEINKVNLEALQKAGKVDNAITIADMGNFVISPELLTDIEGFRSDFQPLLNIVNFQETLSLQMAWLKRSGDVAMSEVENCDDDANGNLKPISEYSATYNVSNLKELAAVTPVCDNATRFLAVDLLGDVAQGYRTDYDRKRAQLLIARLQQAVNTTGNKLPYNGTSDLTTLESWADMFAKVSEVVPGGVAVFNDKTRWELVKRALGAGISGPLAALLMTGDLSPIFGKNYVIVPNELMPSLNTGVGIETKSFTIEGAAVSIDQAVFFFDPRTFAGRTSGGLKYDFSTEAAYEVGGVVKSAFQRNELVLRGSFFRGGAIKDTAKVSSMFAAGVS